MGAAGQSIGHHCYNRLRSFQDAEQNSKLRHQLWITFMWACLKSLGWARGLDQHEHCKPRKIELRLRSRQQDRKSPSTWCISTSNITPFPRVIFEIIYSICIEILENRWEPFHGSHLIQFQDTCQSLRKHYVLQCVS